MKKILLITFAIIISMTANAQSLVWDGAAEPWTHGSGTQDNPYLIETPQNLAYLAQKVNGEPYWNFDWTSRFADTCFLLTADIDLGGANNLIWDPIGIRLHYSNDVCFAGHFDGGGHVISNMKITNDNTYQYDYYGLFGYAKGGSIRNVVLDNTCSIQIDDCYDYWGIGVGSVVGYGKQMTINDCNSAATIRCKASWADMESCSLGGICGLLMESSISGCFFNGNVNCNAGSEYNVVSTGGIVGLINATKVTDCHNAGNIENKITDNQYFSFNYAYLESGGIAGIATGIANTISFCSNTGRVLVDDVYFCCPQYSGGILGCAWGEKGPTSKAVVGISYCHNVANVSTKTIDNTNVFAGGIVGEIGALSKVNVSNCYHVGNLDADHIGGIMVPESDSVSVTNSYFIDICDGDNGFGVPKTDAFMKSAEFVNLLNADSVVFVLDVNNINGGYPIFANGSHHNIGENQSIGNVISCYPNPVSDKVNIEIPTDIKVENISLFDLSGRMIKTQTTGLETIDISGFAPGVYVMKIVLENGKVFEEKIVKK